MYLEHLERWWVCDPANIFFTSKFSYLTFYNPTNKPQCWTANSWGTTNSKPHGPINMMGQSEILSRHQIIYITLFSAGVQHCCAFYQPTQSVQFCWAKPAYFNFSSSILTVQDHILSSAGDALRVCHISPWRCQLLPLLESQLWTGLGLTGYISSGN